MKGDGPTNARIMVVGEAFGEREEQTGLPFQGASGQLLNGMLQEAGIMRSECYTTNLINRRPLNNDLSLWIAMKKKDVTSAHVPLRDKMVLPIVKEGYLSLLNEISLIKPHIILALGNAAMWSLTGQWGILKWRGSQLLTGDGIKLIPTIHPAAVLREYSLRPIIIRDIRRAANERGSPTYSNIPEWNFRLNPTVFTILSRIESLIAQAEAEGHLWVEFDLETSPRYITCAGISWSRTDALCIPFTGATYADHHWTLEEEAVLVFALRRLLTHPKIWVRGQNLLYDCQHTYRHWHFVPNVKQDTMITHHTAFSGLKKSLDFQASMYCDYYSYWKEMHKDQSNKAGA